MTDTPLPPYHGFEGRIATTVAASEPWWPPRPTAPAGAIAAALGVAPGIHVDDDAVGGGHDRGVVPEMVGSRMFVPKCRAGNAVVAVRYEGDADGTVQRVAESDRVVVPVEPAGATVVAAALDVGAVVRIADAEVAAAVFTVVFVTTVTEPAVTAALVVGWIAAAVVVPGPVTVTLAGPSGAPLMMT